MPLPKCNLNSQYHVMLWTFGPINPDDPDKMRQRIYELFANAYKNSGLLTKNFMCAFEEGEDHGNPYYHCHVGIKLTSAARVSKKLLRDVKALCSEDEFGRRPNAGTHYVPRNHKGCPYKVVSGYLTSPHKSKKTDDGAIDFVPIRPPSFKPVNPQPQFSALFQVQLHECLEQLSDIICKK